jgi:hypothetical protein
LLVHGGFAANQVKPERTFGSLRDEEPNPGTPAGSQIGLVWKSCGTVGNGVNGEPCPPSLNGLRCIDVNEGSEPQSNGWFDNQLCVPDSSPVHLAWTSWENNPGNSPPSLNYLKTHDFRYCTKWDVPADYSSTWNDNWLCSDKNVGLNFQLTKPPEAANQSCIPIIEIADHTGNWAGPGYFLCEPKAAAAGGPTSKIPPFKCSNAPNPGAIYRSCAAEIFEFSPELFLSKPNIDNAGNGPWDAVTSLPPVL